MLYQTIGTTCQSYLYCSKMAQFAILFPGMYHYFYLGWVFIVCLTEAFQTLSKSVRMPTLLGSFLKAFSFLPSGLGDFFFNSLTECYQIYCFLVTYFSSSINRLQAGFIGLCLGKWAVFRRMNLRRIAFCITGTEHDKSLVRINYVYTYVHITTIS